MTGGGIRYTFIGQPWKHKGQSAWYFISLPTELGKEIRDNLKWQEEGWGRLKAIAQIGNSQWKTSIWFDSKMNTYLLPLKAKRKKEFIRIGKSLR
ncbi:MAG: DUF1905 domain-containing protein [Cyclobacteriaceae bacterium]|nr:DUF1905 domain-containing protein [Cyclobacteriaceae bacterium]